MSVLLHVSCLALRGAARAAGEMAGVGAGTVVVDTLVTFLARRFTDQSQRLTRALERSTTRAWQAVEIALAGSSWWDQCKLALTSASERAFRDQVQTFLQAHPLDSAARPGDLGKLALAELRAARKAGLLDRGQLPPDELARRVGDLSRFGDPVAVIEMEYQAIARVSDELRRAGYEYLAQFLTLHPGGGPPLLAAAARFFFQREVESDPQLFQGLAYARLESLAEGQAAGFAGLADALDRHGEQIEALLADVHAAVLQTRGDVLDVKAELARQGQQMRELGEAVLKALGQHQLERRELAGNDSLSVRDEEERRLVRDLVRRYRVLPVEQRRHMPALLNAIGKLEVVAGDFESAQRDFRELSGLVTAPEARAEASHNAYRAALEHRAWNEALTAVREAATLAPARFAPFPLDKYEPESILGAGGFGVAFLCRNRHSGGRVVIKTLRRDLLDRDLNEVFREAHVLEELEHPAIIRIRDCDYADAARTRPYLVMDHFPGYSLAEHVEQNGPVSPAALLPLARQVAAGLERAHARGILHRDIKPGNVLVRRDSAGWAVKIIDFGLAMQAVAPGSTRRSSVDRTLVGSSLAGTLDYAAPEQLGRLKGVAVGTYSDVYGFGKTCCYALFATPQPTYQHWQSIPRSLADLLGRCLSEQPAGRPANFTVVLRELERIDAPRPVEKPVPIVLDAQPVEEVRPLPLARPEPRRSLPPVEELEEVEPTAPPRRRSLGVGLLLVGFLGLGTLGGLAILALFWLRGGPLPPIPRPPQPGELGWLTTPAVKAEPIAAEQFPEVLAELKKKPASSRLQELARRLAVTDPGEEQKKKHKQLGKLEELLKSGGTNPRAVERARDEDDITQVSRALEPLLADANHRVKEVGVLAAQKWGTPVNVPALIRILEDGYEGGVLNLRLNTARALGAIGDDRGIAPVAFRLTDPWDRGQGVADVLVRFGSRAESHLWPYVEEWRTEKGKKVANDVFTRRAALETLEKVGTTASLPRLEKLAQSAPPLLNSQATASLQALKKRLGKW